MIGAGPILEKLGDKPPKTRIEVYAREQVLLDKMPATRKLCLQALRIGELGIAAIPAEVFAITGLKIRRRSALQPTFTISMANGADGYLPPPEQMAMGGYTTYLARSSCLETVAEPKVTAAVLRLLDKVAGDQKAGDGRVAPAKRDPSPYEAAVAKSKPFAFLPLDDMDGPSALDTISGKKLGRFETQIAYYMSGPQPPQFPGMASDNRAAHFVGQRLLINSRELGGRFTADKYAVEFWFYNAMPCNVRETTGYLFSLGPLDDQNHTGDHLAIAGNNVGRERRRRGQAGLPRRRQVERFSAGRQNRHRHARLDARHPGTRWLEGRRLSKRLPHTRAFRPSRFRAIHGKFRKKHDLHRRP